MSSLIQRVATALRKRGGEGEIGDIAQELGVTREAVRRTAVDMSRARVCARRLDRGRVMLQLRIAMPRDIDQAMSAWRRSRHGSTAGTGSAPSDWPC